MSYKSDFQANNIDLQNILNMVNSLPNKVNLDSELDEQEALLDQIRSALSGSGDVSQVGVFTTTDTGDAKFLFIKGMTFGEFCNSKMNVYQLDASNANHDMWFMVNKSGGCYSFLSPYISISGDISEDGTYNKRVFSDTIIQEIEYQYYNMWGWEEEED